MITPALSLTVQHMDGEHFQTQVRTPQEEGRGWRAVLAYYLHDGWVRHPMLDALHANAGHSDLAQVQRLLERGANPNLRLILGTYPHATMLGWAVDMGDKPLIELLAKHHVDLELPYGNRAETPLCAALRCASAKQTWPSYWSSWVPVGRVTAAWRKNPTSGSPLAGGLKKTGCGMRPGVARFSSKEGWKPCWIPLKKPCR